MHVQWMNQEFASKIELDMWGIEGQGLGLGMISQPKTIEIKVLRRGGEKVIILPQNGKLEIVNWK